MTQPARTLLLAVCLLGVLAGALPAQNNCGVPLGTATTALPAWAGTLPGSADMSTAYGANYLYVLTQWGFARAALNGGSNPSPYAQIVMGQEAGSGSPGIIKIYCDCHQGSNTMDVAEAPDGTARMISDWQPFAQGNGISGLAGQVAKTTGAGNPAFGQQINLPDAVAPSARLSAIYIASTGKYFGYFPVINAGVYLADVTNPTGSSDPGSAIQPTLAIGWQSGAISGTGVRLRAAHVTVGTYDKYLLVGATASDDVIHVAEINTSTGSLSEVASFSASVSPSQLEVTVVNGEIYIFGASSVSGLKLYKFTPPNAIVEVAVPSAITGTIKKVDVSGPAPFPAMTLYRDAGGNGSFIDIWDTKWVQGSQPILARELKHFLATDASYRGSGFEAYVAQSGSTVTAYIYRELNPPPPGLPTAQSLVHTDKIDISCIAADPTAPPVPYATMTNLSAAGRQSPENTKNYFGDKWSIADASVSFLPILQLDWDFHNVGAFTAEKVVTGTDLRGTTYNSAYWPCDELNGGHLVDGTGTGCYASLGTPVSSYQLAMRAQNSNPPDTQTFTSSAFTILQPQIAIVGFDGTTLSVLSGNPNNGDASGSQGNVADATFNWTFTPGGSMLGPIVTVPTGATSFSLAVTYKDGYSTTKGGSIQQVDLVPNFSLNPNPVLKSSSLTLHNLMQKAGAATLNSVNYLMTPIGGSGTLNTTFLPGNGTATVSAPSTIGTYAMTLTYFYTDHNGQPRTAPVTLPFTVTDFQPIPALGIYKDAGHSQPVIFLGTFGLTTGTTYYLFDDEALPNGVPHPGASFYTSTNSTQSIGTGDTLIGSTTNAGPQTWPSVGACTGSCYVKVSVQGTVRAFKYSATSPPPVCPPNCGSPALSLSGPASANVNVAATFVATATGFPGSVSYSWDFGDAGGSPPPPPPPGGCPPIVPHCNGPQIGDSLEALTPGPSTNSHTYTTTGTFTVTVQAVSGSVTKTASRSITIGTGGPPPPLNTFDVTGANFNPFNNTWAVAANVPVTFTGAETDPAATFAWDFGDGTTLPADTANRSVVHAFFGGGSPTVTLIVTNANGSSTGSVRFTVSPPNFQAIMIPGAGSIDATSGVWATDISVTNPGSQPTTVTLYFAAFTDTIPADLSTLPFDSTKSFLLDPGQSWSGVDVVGDPQILNRHGAGKGLLLLKYAGGNAPPIVTARVYFTAQGSSFGTALPSYLVGPYGQQLGTQGTEAAGDQILVGLRDDSLYRFNVSLFNASSQGGLFHLDAFTEEGEQVASQDFAVPPYGQAGVNDTDLFVPDASKRYVMKVSGSAGALQAFASVLDRRNNDLVQVADDTPRVAAAPGTTVDYYIAGVGRIEDAGTNTHWRTDLRFFNTSSLPRNLVLEYHYTPVGATIEKIVLGSLQLGANQGVSIDDIVGTFLNQSSPDDLTVGSVLGLLKVSYQAPTDVASSPLIIGGRIYADLSTGTAGMQLSTYASAQTVPAGGAALVMPGAQTNLRFRTNVGIFAAGDLPTTVRISAFHKDGSKASDYDYVLNNPGQTGAFAQIPMTALAGIDGEPMTIHVTSLSGSAVGSYIVTVDQISADTVFIQGQHGQ